MNIGPDGGTSDEVKTFLQCNVSQSHHVAAARMYDQLQSCGMINCNYDMWPSTWNAFINHAMTSQSTTLSKQYVSMHSVTSGT